MVSAGIGREADFEEVAKNAFFVKVIRDCIVVMLISKGKSHIYTNSRMALLNYLFQIQIKESHHSMQITRVIK